jgi:hypothetical protein
MWPILLADKVGIGFYGRFAIVIAASTVIATPFDAYYQARAPRVTEEDFRRDQSSRVWTGGGLVVIGVLIWCFASIVGFSVTKAGFDMIFNARKSASIRYSRPDRALTEDLIRQATSLLLCITLLTCTDNRTMTLVAACYLVGYLPFSAAVMRTVAKVKPRLPERTKTTGFLTLEAVSGVIYLQGDVIVLGSLVSDTQVGYYSLAAQLAGTAGLIGQSYAATFHDRLRDNGGAAWAGPRQAHIYLGGAAYALAMAVAAGGFFALGAPSDLWLTILIFGAVSAFRFTSAVFTTVLTLQSRDLYRLLLGACALVAKMVLIVTLARANSPGAAVAYLVGDVIAVAGGQRALYGRPAPQVAIA